ncbi:MAG: FAD-dependent oxidoreductase [Bryobacteraceae bacterium]|nr:FAD-dependent oxidoreductase [Bryobacteraceae bacterium]
MRLVVIGGVAAGLSAAARARRIDKFLDITVLEKGEWVSYAACGLPYFIEGRVRALDDLVLYAPDRFARERNVTVRVKSEVAAIAHSRREVVLADGAKVHYDRLVIATGARPNLAGIGGRNQERVFTLHTLADARRLREFLCSRKPKTAVVVGSGYIGLEAVEALRTNGLKVTLVADDARILGRSHPTLSKAVLDRLEQFHVEFRPGERVRKIEHDSVAGIPCDLVVLATGLKPNVELAQEAGVETGRTGAIRVTDRMETNLAGVFAAGDCAEAMHLVTGRPAYVPLGTTANKMGRVAGACAAGARERFPGIVGTSIVRTCGLGIGLTGLTAGEAKAEGFDAASALIEAPVRPSYYSQPLGIPHTQVELVADRRTGKLLGGLVLGEEGVAGRVNVIAAGLHLGAKVDEFAQFDFAYAPPFAPVWDPLLIAAQQLAKRI